ncbi:hypothetical protein [Nonomuraea sp. NPDC003754]
MRRAAAGQLGQRGGQLRRLGHLGLHAERPDQADRQRLAEYDVFECGAGYLRIQATRPPTLAYGLHDAPLGQLAWIVRDGHFAALEQPDLPAADIKAFFGAL